MKDFANEKAFQVCAFCEILVRGDVNVAQQAKMSQTQCRRKLWESAKHVSFDDVAKKRRVFKVCTVLGLKM